MIDFTVIYKAEFNSIGNSFLTSSLGYLIGSLSASSYKWINRQTLLMVLLLVDSGSTMAMPNYGLVTVFLVANVINGIGSGSWDSSSAAWTIEMWPPRQSSSLIQSGQFMYGLGSIIAPLLVASSLHDENNATTNFTISAKERQNYLQIPYAVAGLTLVIGNTFFAFVSLLILHFFSCCYSYFALLYQPLSRRKDGQ